MFGVDSSELIIVAIAALIFIGPKDLPRVMRTVGQWVGRVRGMARHFTSGIENIMREAELEEMEKKWREENARIMAQFPTNAAYPEPGLVSSVPPAQSTPQNTTLMGSTTGAQLPPGIPEEQSWAPASAGETPEPDEPHLPLDLPRRDLP